MHKTHSGFYRCRQLIALLLYFALCFNLMPGHIALAKSGNDDDQTVFDALGFDTKAPTDFDQDESIAHSPYSKTYTTMNAVDELFTFEPQKQSETAKLDPQYYKLFGNNTTPLCSLSNTLSTNQGRYFTIEYGSSNGPISLQEEGNFSTDNNGQKKNVAFINLSYAFVNEWENDATIQKLQKGMSSSGALALRIYDTASKVVINITEPGLYTMRYENTLAKGSIIDSYSLSLPSASLVVTDSTYDVSAKASPGQEKYGTITVGSNLALTPIFSEQESKTVAISMEDNGNISWAIDNVDADEYDDIITLYHGESLTLTAEPRSGYEINDEYVENSTVTIIVTLDSGYRLTDVSCDDEAAEIRRNKDGSFTITIARISAPIIYTVTAISEADLYSVTDATIDKQGYSVTVEGNDIESKYEAGSSVSIIITPNDDYNITSVSSSDDSIVFINTGGLAR